MRILQSRAWSDRTCRSLNTEKKAMLEFCEVADIQFLPLNGDQLCYFAVWLMVVRQLKAPRSIKIYLSAVRTIHRRLGIDCHTASSYGPLDQLLKGFQRESPHRVKKALPITPTILANLLDSVPHNPRCPTQHHILNTYKALSLLLFQTMSRSSNMVPESRKNFDLRYLLKWGDIKYLEDGIVIHVAISKTNQFGTNDHDIPVATSSNPKYCPVATLTGLAETYGPRYLTPDAPVFLIPSPAGGFVPLKKSEFVGWLKTRLRQMGLPAERYGVHSFRHGAVQTAVQHESNRLLIQLASGHSSDALLGYALIPPERRFHLSRKVNAVLAQL